MADKIDGKAFAAKVRENVAKQVHLLKNKYRITPGLAVILVGDDPASQVYVKNKGKQTIEVGMKSFEYKLDTKTSEDALLNQIQELNNDMSVNGILCQLPLPKHMNEELVINSINPQKDVDGFHVSNVGLLHTGQDSLVPCTPLGCLLLLKNQLGDLSGKTAVVVGRSNIVGKPMASLLLRESCTVTIAHSRTKNIKKVCSSADILIAAVGRPNMIDADWVKPGATVIDVGINRVVSAEHVEGKAKIVGDVNYESVEAVASAVTPVPGGVGPMTIACLLANTVTACCRANNIPVPKELTG
ncbi:MAG: bifunctional methylenetetrahydrofolate dehydrogenase/methenyltetrahydrofolate cyclohydrolase FolD [Pseudomonadota bacterium]|nr:bifunctional methylenetetrahydrofolate dehydrogenase/methenyltetrahydrofolate cyclohydrolase FolD [Pseudomonadota bacterium]